MTVTCHGQVLSNTTPTQSNDLETELRPRKLSPHHSKPHENASPLAKVYSGVSFHVPFSRGLGFQITVFQSLRFQGQSFQGQEVLIF